MGLAALGFLFIVACSALLRRRVRHPSLGFRRALLSIAHAPLEDHWGGVSASKAGFVGHRTRIGAQYSPLIRSLAQAMPVVQAESWRALVLSRGGFDGPETRNALAGNKQT